MVPNDLRYDLVEKVVVRSIVDRRREESAFVFQ